MAEPMKHCKTCQQELPVSDFYRASGRPMAECKSCWCARVRLRRLTDPKVRAYDRARSKLPHRIANAMAVTKRWRLKNPDAYRAQTTLNNAVKAGKISRKDCEMCGATAGIHAHHKDYSRPLEVVWLCARCHHRLHALFPELEGANKRETA